MGTTWTAALCAAASRIPMLDVQCNLLPAQTCGCGGGSGCGCGCNTCKGLGGVAAAGGAAVALTPAGWREGVAE
eukprot:CAMPEP_0204600326 /NCGR_PEP_ID=MMETSP0661-20131031/55377_1 /ASSEMBLY_ACC=CAM_ASM_000606 /TAXON_ID=109239 /ORGANISM="Alexandrium margalefi, Strain AMGDE01CS-322" /LENGTH=73 /DNA_ID=CAMNT_0051611119 /DNA_START=193 /DNA_END=411 /DNA_ORIENTATION=+